MNQIENFGQKTIQKVKWHIIPYILILYVINYIDRANISYAALDMNKELGITNTVFGLLSGIFYIGYVSFEIPSNMLLHRFGARKWIARILISWGIVVSLTTWVQSVNQMYVLRLLLGLAEAGLFPGIILYLTYWFPSKQRARAVALFMTAIPVSSIISAPVSTWIMDNVNWYNLPGWRWMFLLEGVPAIILGFTTIFLLTDRPEQAKWLSQEEKNWLTNELQKEQQQQKKAKNYTMLQVLPKVWRFTLIYFMLLMGSFGVSMWMPTIVKSFSKSLTNTEVGLITMIPYIVSVICMVTWSRHSDKTQERRFHMAIPPLIGAIGLFLTGMASDPGVKIIGITMTMLGIYSAYGPFWSMATRYLSEQSAAVGIATISSVATLAGFFGPLIIGYLKDTTGSVNAGLYLLCMCLILGSLLAFTKRDNEKTSVIVKSGKSVV